MKFNQANHLKLLFVSDIHQSWSNLTLLKAHIQQRHLEFDYCLVGGDIVNCDNASNSHDQSQMQDDFDKILKFLSQISKAITIFIPGNHDPKQYIFSKVEESEGILNLHGKQHQLAVNLNIIGLGGSIPAYLNLNDLSTLVWEGFPFNNEEEFQKEIEKTFKVDLSQPSQTIFFTHVGPSQSSTAIDRSKHQAVFAGSPALMHLLRDNNPLLYLHGHVHHGARYDLIDNKRIINPGALCFGQFAQIQLEKDQKNSWRVNSISFEKLS